ncbi:M20/M25/M40 family metallo-hydrolase [Kutzneria buriramensis]|uniref:Acetylornithine deacetylase/succinyl-diaminopimelate desuccinylase-like protein n=1 Tax=Kutzneria buriramensis TaxID=1045776 RepID=A0A3E0HKX8_9PSEU|nr:M20/M25/M40 family metallo-hydrolase [Kutzneria buriramensis]REH47134.1 acetylornithine deacetylase/succinyl-diaminopimelate desuccinylase-like protein [Kutzneria buriramensis]
MDVVERCARLIRFDTTNRGGGDSEGEREAAEFVAAELSAAGVEPTLLERKPRRTNVIARVEGSDPALPPLLVQAHLDVVPAQAADWDVHPFSGELRDGYLWGRGAVDMKDMVANLLTVVAGWQARGSRPRRDVVLAFVADEEDAGDYGAHWLVAEHADLFRDCVAAIGESGGHTHRVNGIHFYPVGTAERGSSHLRLTARGRAGHGSRRNDENAVTRLVQAVQRLAEHRWPVRLIPSVQAYIEQVGAALGVEVDLSDVDGTVARLGGAASLVESTIRNSTTPTALTAGYKVNVIPSTAEALIDTRVLPGGEAELLATVDELIGPHVRRELINPQPGVQAPLDSPWFGAMADALRWADPAAVVVPYCLGGGTDAKAFARLGIPGYGFSPLWVPEGFDYRAMAHGVNERVPVEGLEFGVRVLDRFLSGV